MLTLKHGIFPQSFFFYLMDKVRSVPIYNRAITATESDHSPGRRTNKSESSQRILGVPNTIER